MDPFDEALAPGGAPHPHTAGPLAAVRARGLAAAADAVREAAAAQGMAFRVDGRDVAFHVDPVPRVLAAGEWAALEAGLAQRVRALEAFVADAYGARRCVAEGVVPARVIETAEFFERAVGELPDHGTPRIGVAGLDVVRTADGTLEVLEDNTRVPSGLAFALGIRAAVRGALDVAPEDEPRGLDDAATLLRDVLVAAAPPGAPDPPRIALLSAGPEDSAWWEHRTLARLVDVPIVLPDELRVEDGRLLRFDGARRAPLDVVYRRTDENRLDSPIGQVLAGPLRAGTLGVVNAPGTGVADDKLVHAYVDDLVRLYLGEEPLVRGVRTFDPGDPEGRAELLDRLEELVVKPRGGHGGKGVVLCPLATPDELEQARRELGARPDAYVVQELVQLSTHPTVVGDALAPRHVDLRPFVFSGTGGSVRAMPGGLTRVALREGEMVVNSSREGGAKDTWVRAR
ncbi:circularly permuted type 2 ATP-grasp protein [Conexibacter sp. SYSU D00693]|uniref:circularly permuted type 2 ATP-grasp protein n=1 Tax=Conexibacter sp. SYSU D00693 TaxID=2812560 RepID=UPI00196A3BC7|nr:circularly permuted type 2 ATP-grasp protein [Conexibacter sp. SYSU D00693]